MKLALAFVLIAALAAGGWFYYDRQSKSSASSYRTVEVTRADVTASVSATGTLVPEETVDVGAQVNGPITSLGIDPAGKTIDFRSDVKEGMILARIDETLYAADVATSRAQVAQAASQVKLAVANLAQAKAKLDQSTADWKRAQDLIGTKTISAADYDLARSTYEQMVAGVAVNEAQVDQAKAQGDIAAASLQRAQRNLDYCTIKSPVDGVIIVRSVDVGQTVVASFNSPSLFLIARDLSRMLVLVQVNEADISAVRNVKEVTFTVDAVPGKTFQGAVRKIRLNAAMTQNVVTYTVEISADNPQLVLLPYLTANVRFVTDSHEDVLTVANAALRYQPRDASAAVAAARSDAASRPSTRRGRNAGTSNRGTLWTVGPDGKPTPLRVRTLISDGAITEIQGENLAEGLQVIIADTAASAGRPAGQGGAPSGDTNPFAPAPRRR